MKRHLPVGLRLLVSGGLLFAGCGGSEGATTATVTVNVPPTTVTVAAPVPALPLTIARARQETRRLADKDEKVVGCQRRTGRIVVCGIEGPAPEGKPGRCEIFLYVKQPAFQTSVQTRFGPDFCWTKPDRSDTFRVSNGQSEYT